MFKQIDHIEIITKNFNKSLKFYKQVLDFKLVNRMKIDKKPIKEIAYLKLNNTMIELLDADLKPGYRMMALEVDNMNKAIQYLKNKGVEISWGPNKYR